MRHVMIALALAAYAQSPLLAQSQPSGEFALSGTSVYELGEASNGADYQIYSWASEDCSEATPCPAVYMLDAEYSFGLSVLIAEHLEARGQLRPLILVGIAYPDKSPVGYRVNRSRDYTITHVPTGGYGPQFQQYSGGADAFLDVIEQDIIPWVEARYPTSAAERGLIGHSFGGLFGSYALITRPGVFTDYLIVSPSLWYDNREIFAIEQASDQRPGTDRQVFMSVGAHEEQPGTGRAMVSDMLEMGERLAGRGDPRLEVETEVLDGQTHASIFPLALSNGLRKLFAPD